MPAEDREGADFYKDVQMMVDQLGTNPLPIQLPIGKAAGFKGVYDLVEQRSIIWTGEELGANFEYSDEIPEGMEAGELVAKYREEMVEKACEQDEEALEAYLETGEAPDIATLKKCIRKGTLSFSFWAEKHGFYRILSGLTGFVPVLCGTAFKNKGVQPLLDAVCDYLPSPLDLPPTKGKNPKKEDEELVREASPDEKLGWDSWDWKLSGLAFKVAADPYIGTLTFYRIYSGKVKAGDMVWNPRSRESKSKERMGRMVLMHSNKREEIKEAQCGDIIAIVGLKDTTTGDTLCSIDDPVVLEKMDFPEPVIKVSCEPTSQKDADKLGEALNKLAAEETSFKGAGLCQDPSFRYSRDDESNQTAKLCMVYEPNPGEGFEFTNSVVGGAVPKEYVPAVVKGTEGR
eukprot:Skav206144  [mRNA]  locus=scaffold6089:2651:7402:+ [translate_table: standard]